MARFKIISKDGSSVKYEGKLRYIGSYLKPSYVEFSEISSPTPINWEIGDYVDYSRTGMRYRLFSVPQVVKNARAGSHGNAFSYTNVQFFAATKELEIALFRDLVSGDNNMHFSTSPDVATFEDVAGIARRIQACMDDLYPGKWVIKVADFDAESDAEVIEKITTAKDFALSGGTCLDALSKIYELWQDIGWIHSYDPTREKDIITIGYANKRIDANTTDAFLYGKGNGLTAIKKSQANKDEFATRLYVYGSERNLPARYYNDKDILNAESVDIRNLMLPMDVWGVTDGKPDARKAYIENAEAVAKIGIIPRVHYFDSEDAGADIYPSIEGMTVGMLRKVLSDMGDTAYSPSYEIYADASERVDEVGGVISLPTDEGKIGEAIELTTIFIPSFSKTKSTGIVESVDLIESHILYEGLIKSSFEMGEITVKPSLECTVTDADFSSVVATLTLDDSLGASTSSPSKTISIPAEYDESRNLWVLPLKDISVKYDKKSSANGFYIYLYISISATKNNPGVGSDAIASVLGGKADIEVKQILSKTFNIRLKQIGFNLNLQADLGQGKTISMKTGKCAGRNFVISSAKYNPGTDSWDITCKRQQDETLGLLFPNTNYEIQAGDRFVLLDIVMPESYIRVAMERLLAEGQRLFNQVSTVRSNYEPSIDAKLMAESGRHLREGMFMEISDSDIVDNTTEHILIDTLSIYEDESAIPTYKVTLRERRKVTYKGTPSAAATTKTSSVEDGETDMSEYAKTAYVDKKDKEFSSTLSKILDWFSLEDGVLLTKYNLASEKEVSAKGINASQGGGTSYNRLDSWSAYDSSKAGYVLSALLGYDLHSRVTNLENAEVDLSDYYTKSQTNSQIASAIGAIDLSPYATKEALNILEGKHDALRNEFNALSNLLSSDTTDYINTWNEVVAFLDGYKDESDLATILSGMNADISSRLLASDFELWKTNTFTPLENLVANHTTRLDGVDKTIEDHIAEFIAFRANFEISDDLILVRKNFASTEEVSAKGINQGTGGGGGSSYSRLDTWEGYDNNKAGYVLSAGLGYGLKVAIDELNGYDLDNRVRSIENSYVSKDAGGVVNGGLVVSSLAVAGGSSSQFLKADGSLDSTSYLSTSGGTINGYFGAFSVKRYEPYASAIKFENSVGILGYIGINDDYTPLIWDKDLNTRILLHSGNIASYALSTSGGTIEGNLTLGAEGSNTSQHLFRIYQKINGLQHRALMGILDSGDAELSYYCPDDYTYKRIVMGHGGFKIGGWELYDIIHSGNIGSQSVAYASNAGNAITLNGYSKCGNGDLPSWGTIPSVGNDGVMDIGKYIDFRDDSSLHDYSTRLMCTGKYANVVNLPSANGTLALLTDNVAGAQKLVDGSGSPIIHNSGATFYIGDTIFPTIPTHILGSEIVLRYGASATNGLILDSNGNVLIGTSTDNGAKLQVNGSISTSHIKSTSGLDITANNEGVGSRLFLTSGVFRPWGADAGQIDFGSSDVRWRDIYANGLNINNGAIISSLTVTGATSSSSLYVSSDIVTNRIIIGGVTLSTEDGVLKIESDMYATGEISAHGLNKGESGGGGSSYSRLDTWIGYDSSKAGYVLSAGLGYDLKLAVDDLNGYNLNSRLATVESNYLGKNGGVATNLTVYGGTINGDFIIDRSISTILYYKDGVRLGFMGFRDELEPIIYDAAGHYSYDILHSGNIASYAITTSGGILNGSLQIGKDDNTAYNYLRLVRDGYEMYVNCNSYGGYMSYGAIGSESIGQLRLLANAIIFNGNTLIHSGNIGSQSVAYASNAGTVGGYAPSYGSNTPWGTIPVITQGGWMDVGKSFEFHYDNTTGSDYSTVLSCTGNHGNFVSLPSASGTLALTTDTVAAALATYDNEDGSGFLFGGRRKGMMLNEGGALIYAYGNNPISLYTNHVERARVNGYGNVTIGGSDLAGTSYKLYVDGKLRLPYLYFYGNNIYSDTDGLYIQPYGAGIVNINQLGTNTFINNSGGNVGIGTTDPQYKLHVKGTGYFSDALTANGGLTVNGILTVGGASIHPTANNPYFQLYQNNKYWYWQADDNYTYIGGTTKKALQIDQEGNTLIRGSLGVDALLTASNGLTVSGLSTFTGGVVAYDIHGNGQSLYLGNASNNAFIKVREDMVGSTSMWSIPRDGKATFTSLTTPTLSVTGSATIANVTIDAGNATLSNLTVNTAATLKQLVVGIDGMSCNAPATFNDFIYGSSITPRTDNYYVLGNNNYKWYAVTAYNVNVHDAITIEAGKELRFKDNNGVVHSLRYDSDKQAFVFDGNVNATGEMSAKKLNA